MICEAHQDEERAVEAHQRAVELSDGMPPERSVATLVRLYDGMGMWRQLVELRQSIADATEDPAERAELLFEIATRNSVALPYASVEELRAAYEFEDLQLVVNDNDLSHRAWLIELIYD